MDIEIVGLALVVGGAATACCGLAFMFAYWAQA